MMAFFVWLGTAVNLIFIGLFFAEMDVVVSSIFFGLYTLVSMYCINEEYLSK